MLSSQSRVGPDSGEIQQDEALQCRSSSNRFSPARPMSSLALIVAVCCSWCFSTSIVWGDESKFEQSVKVDGTPLQLNGKGLCEWGIFGVDLYYGALYVTKKSRNAKTILQSTGPKRIELRFVRSLTRKQMVKAYTESAKATAGRAIEKYRASLEKFTKSLTAVKKGTRLVVDDIPGKGLVMSIDGKVRCTIEDDAFAKLYFTLYLGSKPPTDDLKKALLGR